MDWANFWLRGGELSLTAEELFRWWVGELRALVPACLWRPIAPRQSMIVLDFLGDRALVGVHCEGTYRPIGSITVERPAETDTALISRLVKQYRTDRALIRLPADKVLRRTLELPAAAKTRLQSILAHEIERQIPLEADRVLFDYRLLARNSRTGALKVELVVVRKDLLRRVTALTEQVELGIRYFGLVEDAAFVQRYRFGSKELGRTSSWGEAYLARGLGIAAVLLLGAFIATAGWKHHLRSEYVEGQLSSLRGQAQQVARLQQQLNTVERRIEFLQQRKSESLFVDILREITDILPDGTWLVDLTQNGSTVRLQGYAPVAARLIEQFDKSSLFTNARFAAPVTQGQRSSLEHFDLSLDLREKSGP